MVKTKNKTYFNMIITLFKSGTIYEEQPLFYIIKIVM